MEQKFTVGDLVVMVKKCKGKAVKGAKGVIVPDLYSWFGVVSIRFQGTHDVVSGIPQDFVKKQVLTPAELPKDDFEIPVYTANMSDIVLINWLDMLSQRIRGEKWRHYTRGTRRHTILFLQAVATSKRRPDLTHMADEALQNADAFSLNER